MLTSASKSPSGRLGGALRERGASGLIGSVHVSNICDVLERRIAELHGQYLSMNWKTNTLAALRTFERTIDLQADPIHLSAGLMHHLNLLDKLPCPS